MQDNLQLNYNDEIKKCKTLDDLVGPDGVIKKMLKAAIEGILHEELRLHLEEKKNNKEHNSKNGSSPKTVRSTLGEFELITPRDRKGTFEPQVVKKYQKDISDFDQKIISMYAKGMTTRDIQEHMNDIYGIEMSPAMVSMITDKVMSMAREWQNRILEEIYAVVYFDAIHFKVRENGRIVSKAAYTALGIDTEGKKDILGIWVGESEGATFWLSVMNELKNRGVKDILIACIDGLKGFPAAISVVFPRVEIQLCVIHMIRNSVKYISSKNRAKFIEDLKQVYQALTLNEALYCRDKLVEKWGAKYPLAVNPWVNHWENVSNYFKYPMELRRIIYTTNTVEGLHRQFRKVTKNRAILANDDSLFKILYLAASDIQRKWTHAVRGWNVIITQLHIVFKERLMTN